MTKLRFENQVAVITGAADGIGRAVAERIVAEGGQVMLWDIQEQKLMIRITALNTNRQAARFQVVDVSDEAQVQAAYQEVINTYGKLDVLVHAAGIVGPTQTKITDYQTKDFDKVYQVNLRGAFLVTKYALPHMETNAYGRILLIASIAGKEGNPNMCGYSASKAGVIGLVKSIGKEWASTGITVNGIAPAVIKTPMNADTAPEQLEYMAAKIPMQRLGTVDETASLACWIVSEESSFTTAFVFDLSGGRATY